MHGRRKKCKLEGWSINRVSSGHSYSFYRVICSSWILLDNTHTYYKTFHQFEPRATVLQFLTCFYFLISCYITEIQDHVLFSLVVTSLKFKSWFCLSLSRSCDLIEISWPSNSRLIHLFEPWIT